MRIGPRKTIALENPLRLFKDSTIGDWWSASETSTMFTDTGATTLIAANSDAVKCWTGKRGVGNNPTEATNNPTYQSDLGGCVRFNGTNDLLTLANFDCFNTGACTVIAVVKANPGTSCHLCGWGNSASSAAIYSLTQSGSSVATSMSAFARTDIPATLLALTVISPLGYNNTPKVLAAVDTGSRVIGYQNGVAGDPVAYTRSGTTTINRFAIGALVRDSIGGWFAMDLYDLFVIGRALNQTEVINASRFLGRPRGIFF